MRILRHIIAALALCAVFCVPSHADSPALNQLATKLVGSPVTVECFPPNDEVDGFVVATSSAEDDYQWHMGHVIHLAGDYCGALQNVLTPGPRTAKWLHSFEGTQAVGVGFLDLLHEVTHITLSSINEGLVECTAYRNVWTALRVLNLDPRMRTLVYREAVYSHFDKPITGPLAKYRSQC